MGSIKAKGMRRASVSCQLPAKGRRGKFDGQKSEFESDLQEQDEAIDIQDNHQD